MSTHTASGCTQQTSGFLGTFMMAGYAKNNCDAYATNSQGCGVRSTDKESLGAPFNNKGGGVFALKWDDNGVSTYHFARSNVPSDITSNDPNPGTWGTPDNFVHPDSCNPKDHFKDLMLVFNTNLCGVWGSGVWNDDMSYAGQTGSCASRTGFATCEDYVKNSGKDFSNAACKINSMKIFQY